MSTTDKTLYIFGASGHGKVVADAAQMSGAFARLVFADADATLVGTPIHNTVIRHEDEVICEMRSTRDGEAIIAIGDNATRARLATRLHDTGITFATVKHPQSAVATSATLGMGSVVMAGAVVQADAEIGEGVILNTCSSIDHDCRVGDYVHCGPGSTLCGDVTVDDQAFVGAGATVIPGISIGARAIIGAGAVVVHDVPDDATVMGVPARVTSSTDSAS